MIRSREIKRPTHTRQVSEKSNVAFAVVKKVELCKRRYVQEDNKSFPLVLLLLFMRSWVVNR